MTEPAVTSATPVINRDTTPIIQTEELSKTFMIRGRDGLGRKQPLNVLEDISLAVYRGECFGLVGETGSGKSTLARCLLHLHEPTGGRVLFDGVDLSTLKRAELRALRRRMQIVFQDPYTSLEPRMTAGTIVEEPLIVHGIGNQEERRELALQTLAEVGLTEQHAKRRPLAFSGGQRQRIAVARAFVLRPDLVILDEPLSALDVSVQAQVLNLLRRLQAEHGMTYVFISHDLAVAEYFCDRVAVLYLGQIMEVADRATLFGRPLHPYTVSLLSAVPIPRAGGRARRASRPQPLGEAGSVAERPSGCVFEPRCPVGHGRHICRDLRPPISDHGNDHIVACHFPGEAGIPAVAGQVAS